MFEAISNNEIIGMLVMFWMGIGIGINFMCHRLKNLLSDFMKDW